MLSYKPKNLRKNPEKSMISNQKHDFQNYYSKSLKPPLIWCGISRRIQCNQPFYVRSSPRKVRKSTKKSEKPIKTYIFLQHFLKRTYQGLNIRGDPIIEKSQDQDQGQGQGQDQISCGSAARCGSRWSWPWPWPWSWSWDFSIIGSPQIFHPW